MKSIREVLSNKESELQRLHHDIDVLRQALRLLEDDSDVANAVVTVHAGASRSNQPDAQRTSPSAGQGIQESDSNERALKPFP